MRPSLPISRLALVTALAVTSLGVEAEDLFQVYRDAQRYDAAYSSARYLCAAARPLPMDTEAGFLDAAYSYSHSSTYPMTSWINSAPYRMASQAAQ